MATFRDRLEKALALRNMSAATLSKLTHIGEASISQYRKGAYKATQPNLEKISAALNVPIPWLMGISDDCDDFSSLDSDSMKTYLREALIKNFNQLNLEGQERLVEEADILVTSGKYKKTNQLDLAHEA